MKIDDVINAIVEIAKSEPTIKRVWVFGSRFTNTHRLDSDLDLAIEVEWVSGKSLGYCVDFRSLWSATLPTFKEKIESISPWDIDFQQYSNEEETPTIHAYIESGKMIYEKH